MDKKMNVGVVGCGNISTIYLKNLTELFTNVNVYGVADLDEEKAKNASEKYNVPVMTLDEMLSDKNVDIILNITAPQGHYPICKKALLAGKHVYVEKPLSLEYKQGKELLQIAEEKGLYIGCAPDTFLGAGIQTCINLINSDTIGKPIGATAFMMCHGHESWHPAPEFYYNAGGGPLFDMGPYYITALVRMIGGVKSVFAYADKSFATRTITSEPQKGKVIPVNVDTHITALLKFENGCVATIIMSFDVWKHNLPHIEIYGTKGSLSVPDPNGFGGSVKVATIENRTFTEVPLVSAFSENCRGLGLSETALAISENRINNASGKLGLHVLEIMDKIIESSKQGKELFLESVLPKGIPLKWNVDKKEFSTKNV